ncbi:MAG: hypothetical protein IMX06_08795 [Kyrpidia tusciae]|nr:hypothetical protein [Kyrpidia tusciae]MBE3552939.1 hypothetical protein [Kyrpidia tusciae]
MTKVLEMSDWIMNHGCRGWKQYQGSGKGNVLIGASAMVVEQYFARVETAHL